jgi:enoyl-CoA hydratase/carnithine racemase
LAKDLQEALNKAIDNQEHQSIIITSDDEKNFSQGIDVDWLTSAMQQGQHQEVQAFMYAMDEVFKTLLLSPIPVIAAINGHAFGNGAILSCACDFRLMRSERGFFCFPEIDLSIPFLPGMLAFIQKAVPNHYFNELSLTGKRATAEELLQNHVISQAFDNTDSLQQGALAMAKTFQKKRGIFGEHKKRLYRNIIKTINTENQPYIDHLQLTA